MQIGRARMINRSVIANTAKVLAGAVALTAFAAAAQADGTGTSGMKDPLPDTVSAGGVTVYGTIDVGYGFETNGLPLSGALYTGQQYNIFGTSKSSGNISSLTESALSQSFIGVKAEESMWPGVTAIAKIETGFNPLSGEIADACQDLVRLGNALKNGTTLQGFGDGSRCGQAVNGEGYAGISSTAYGTLTIGRMNSLQLDADAVYDPMALSYALSILGWSGSVSGGAGSTEDARWDNSIKYIYQYGPFHAAAQFASGEQDSQIHYGAGGGDIGVTYMGFSADFVYMRENGAVNSQLGTLGTPGLTSTGLAFNGVPPSGTNINSLYYYFTDNESYSIMAKYTLEFPGEGGLKDGGCGLKDDCQPAKLTFYGGYQHMDQTNPGQEQTPLGAPGGTTIGGYILLINNLILNDTRTTQTEWVGAKYELPWGLSFTGAYYHFSQNNFSLQNFFAGGSLIGVKHSGGCSVNAYACAGDENQGSFLVDYVLNKHVDFYAGVTYQDISGGLAHSSFSNDAFEATNNTTFVSGMRLKF